MSGPPPLLGGPDTLPHAARASVYACGMDRDDIDLQALRAEAASGAPDALYRLAAALVVRQQFDEALALHQRAAVAGHAGAQVALARMLLHGIACAADPHAAVGWLAHAEAAGNEVAGTWLAMIALGGVAAPRDERIDARVLAAVNAGLPPAQRAAAIHFGRKPHRADQSLCIALLEDAALKGDAICALLLAERLARGEGCERDPDTAAALHAELAKAGIAPLPAVTAAPPSQPASPSNTLQLLDVLRAPDVDWRSRRPRVGVIDALLSADECRLLIAAAQPALRASQTVDPDTGLPIRMPIRTSSDASIDPIVEDMALRLVQLRMCAAAGIDLPHAEHLTVLRYEPGQQYRPHRDYVPPGTVERDHPEAGNRARTICVYLNDVEAGGETEFPLAGVRVAPKAGRAVVFDNLLPNGQPDVDSLHAGLPVERGEKWLATLWIRQRRYRDF